MKDIIERVLSEVLPSLVDSYDRLGMRASGDWAEALEVKADDRVGQIWGNDYTQYLTNGREPGGMPPVSALEKWVGDKFGISGPEATSAAWAISKKIAKEGTTWYPQGSDLLEAVFTDEVVNSIIKEVGFQVSQQLAQELIREIA